MHALNESVVMTPFAAAVSVHQQCLFMQRML
jgi:hypothetical protein